MEPVALLLLMVVFVLVGLFVAQPFSKHWRVTQQSSHEVSSLLAERERTLNALIELDFDNGIGKIPTEEYSAQRASLIQKGSNILRQLDELHASKLSTFDKPFERAVVGSPVNLLSDEDLEELIAGRRAKRQQKTAGFCPNCGKPILQSDQFCPSCGQILDSN